MKWHLSHATFVSSQAFADGYYSNAAEFLLEADRIMAEKGTILINLKLLCH